MKKNLISTLCLVLSLELILGSYPIQSFATVEAKPGSVTSPAATLAEARKQAEILFGEHGIAERGKDGEVIIVDQATREAIQDPKSKQYLDSKAAIEAFVPLWLKAEKVAKDTGENLEMPSSVSKNCATPGCKAGGAENEKLEEGALCTSTEKKQRKAERDRKGCGFWSEVGHNIMSSNSSNCAVTFVQGLASSIKTGLKSAWGMAVGVKNWAAGLFSSHKATEVHATNNAFVIGALSDKQIKQSSEKTNSDLMSSVGGFFEKIGNFIMEDLWGLDMPQYREKLGCMKCGEVASTWCSILGGSLGDTIKQLAILYLSGKAIDKIAIPMLSRAGVALKGTFKAIGKGGESLLAKSSVGRATLEWGAKKSAQISASSAKGFEAFMQTKAGSAAKWFAHNSKNTAKWFLKKGDQVVMAPTRMVGRLVVKGGRSIGFQMNALEHSLGLVKNVPGLEAKEASAAAPLKTVEEGGQANTLQIELPNQKTPAMAKAENALKRMKTKGSAKVIVDDIENASPVSHEVLNDKAIKFEANGPRYVVVANPETVEKVHPFRNGESALIKHTNGSVDIAELHNGEMKVVKTLSPAEAKATDVDAFMGREQAKANELNLAETKAHAEESGLIAKEQNSSPLHPNDTKLDTGENCGHQIVELGL